MSPDKVKLSARGIKATVTGSFSTSSKYAASTLISDMKVSEWWYWVPQVSIPATDCKPGA
jgi:hypothetical protein